MIGYEMIVQRTDAETRWWKRMLGKRRRTVVVFAGIVTDMQWASAVNSGSYASVKISGEDALSVASRYFMPKGKR